jgi:hypothetical protein
MPGDLYSIGTHKYITSACPEKSRELKHINTDACPETSRALEHINTSACPETSRALELFPVVVTRTGNMLTQYVGPTA